MNLIKRIFILLISCILMLTIIIPNALATSVKSNSQLADSKSNKAFCDYFKLNGWDQTEFKYKSNVNTPLLTDNEWKEAIQSSKKIGLSGGKNINQTAEHSLSYYFDKKIVHLEGYLERDQPYARFIIQIDNAKDKNIVSAIIYVMSGISGLSGSNQKDLNKWIFPANATLAQINNTLEQHYKKYAPKANSDLPTSAYYGGGLVGNEKTKALRVNFKKQGWNVDKNRFYEISTNTKNKAILSKNQQNQIKQNAIKNKLFNANGHYKYFWSIDQSFYYSRQKHLSGKQAFYVDFCAQQGRGIDDDGEWLLWLMVWKANDKKAQPQIYPVSSSLDSIKIDMSKK